MMKKYQIINAKPEDAKIVKEYKKDTLFQYAKNISKEEKNKIETYIKESIAKEIKNYKIIKEKQNSIGAYLITKYLDGVLLDEIYIEKPYRNKKIGTQIIKRIQKEQNIIYLWVYKKNEKAVKLYHKLSFQIIEETETRYFMKYKKRKNQEKQPI